MKKIKILLFSLFVSVLINNVSYGMDNNSISDMADREKRDFLGIREDFFCSEEKSDEKHKKFEINTEKSRSLIGKKRNYEDVKEKIDGSSAEKDRFFGNITEKDIFFDVDFNLFGNTELSGEQEKILSKQKETIAHHKVEQKSENLKSKILEKK